jgi:hypothetical protein
MEMKEALIAECQKLGTGLCGVILGDKVLQSPLNHSHLETSSLAPCKDR